MKIQINTDKNVEGSERLESYFSAELEKALSRYEDKITRLELHFGDENSDKSGTNDKRCLIEVRPANLQPLAVTAFGNTTELAFNSALDKIKRVLETTFEKKKNH